MLCRASGELGRVAVTGLVRPAANPVEWKSTGRLLGLNKVVATYGLVGDREHVRI